MMLKTGSNLVLRQNGFTLIEIMVATAVLSLGVVLIYEAFFISLEAFDYYSNYLNLAPWMDEKVWAAQESLASSASLDQIETDGELKNKGKSFTWNLSYSLIDETQGLYKIDLGVAWQQGKRKVRLSRNAYALYKK